MTAPSRHDAMVTSSHRWGGISVFRLACGCFRI